VKDYAQFVNELRIRAGDVSRLAERCQDDVTVSVRLDDGRVLAPTCAGDDLKALGESLDDLRDLLSE
jgi:hypothetical protein